MKYFLKSSYPCLVKTEDIIFEIDETDTVEICDEEFLFIYPQNKIIPFYINLKNPKDSERFSFLTYNEKKFIVLEKEKCWNVTTKKTLFFSGKSCVVTADNKKISFESDTSKIEILRGDKSQLQDIYKIKDFACVQFEKEFYAFSTKTNQIVHLQGKIEKISEALTLTNFSCDSEGRERQAKFKIAENFEIVDEKFVRSDRKFSCELLPFKMLESVRAKDYSFALSLLSENLKNQLDQSKIREFFGNYSDFLPISTKEFILLSQNEKKFVTFETKNDKIFDINIDSI